ncbi:MAG: pirin family protein [Gammaproteobacteria bacterium]|nr:pirin family protein [Gammaproteobacteria bacterium]
MTIKQIITPDKKDLGEFSVRRALPYANQRAVGPWVFFDHMGPVQFAPGSGINVRPHPHINLATVTYLFDGEILHRDSLGSEQCIRPGDINLMVAGRGITHSERESEEVNSRQHNLHGLQLWHSLPEADEETAPAFYHYPSADLPGIDLGGVPIRVMMGSAYGVTSPVKTFAETLYVEAQLQTGDTLDTPQADELAVYVASGSVNIGGRDVPQYSMAVLDDSAVIIANDESRIAIIGGEKMPTRHLEWNFVSSRRQRIEQAKSDWRNGKFPNVVGDEEEFIPLPE